MSETDANRSSPKGLPTTDGAAAGALSEVIGRNLFDGTFPLPVLVIRESALRRNIETMATFTADHNLLLAPHAKTTMSPQLVSRQLAAGAWGMTVATAWQAAQVAAMDVDRIIIASEVADTGSLRLLDQLLRDRPQLTIWAFADSIAVVDLLDRYVAASGRLITLVEVGVSGGRTGVRGVEDCLRLAEHAAKGAHPLGGIGAFEGIIAGPDQESTLAAVDDFLELVGAVAIALHSRSLLDTGTTPLVTVGGSSYPDRVPAILGPMLAQTPYQTVLRSGCYVTHDSGAYEESSPFGHQQRLPYSLEAALEVWAVVMSRPEETRAIAGLGKRDVSYDAGMPLVLSRGPVGQGPGDAPVGALSVTGLNDQHAYLSVETQDSLAPGDLLRFGISHPCTTFDKWRAIPIVDDAYQVVDVAITCF